MTAARSNLGYWVLALIVVVAVATCIARDECTLLTADQRAYRLYAAGDLEEAADRFADPMWRGVALYRLGEFEQAAGVFAGFDTPEAAYNQATSLVFLGRYGEAVARYDRALELRPGWTPAAVNREIAAARAARLAREGGEGTGGKLGADEIVFSDTKSPPSSGEEQIGGGELLSDQELRSIWLRQVQTRPADFLRVKFASQYAMRSRSGELDR